MNDAATATNWTFLAWDRRDDARKRPTPCLSNDSEPRSTRSEDLTWEIPV